MSGSLYMSMEWLGREMAKRNERLVLAAFSGTRVKCDACDGWGWIWPTGGIVDRVQCDKCLGQGTLPYDPKVMI